jgi:hypothetical protein
MANRWEHSVPVSLDPGAADRLRSALATVVAVPVTPFDCDRAVRPPSRLLPDAVRARVTAILASWELPGESS